MIRLSDQLATLEEGGDWIDYADPVRRDDALLRGMTGWWTCLPTWMGGRTWYDLLGLRHAALTGGAWSASTRPGGWGALSFSGANQASPGLASSHFVTAAAGTLAVWCRPTGAAPSVANVWLGHHVFGDGNNGFLGIYRAVISGADRLWCYNWDGSEDRTGAAYTAGEWTHIVWTHGDGLLSIYRDGVIVSKVVSGATSNLVLQLRAGNTFAGDLDDAMAWGRGLSAAEVARVYDLSRRRYPGLVNRLAWPPPGTGVEQPPDVEGLEYSLPTGRLHYRLPVNRLHARAAGVPLHYRLPDEP